MSEATLATIGFFIVLGIGWLALYYVDKRQERENRARQQRAKELLEKQFEAQKAAREANLKTAAGRIELAKAKVQEFSINDHIGVLFDGLSNDVDITLADGEHIVFSDVVRAHERLSFQHAGAGYEIIVRGGQSYLPSGNGDCGQEAALANSSAILCINGEIVYETSKNLKIEAYVDGDWPAELGDIADKMRRAHQRFVDIRAEHEDEEIQKASLADIERRGARVVFDGKTPNGGEA